MPFIIMQQVMPGIIIVFMQSQQAWIIFSQFLSPDVQVIMHPISIISILHIPIIPMLQQQHIMPFIIMQHETIPPAIMLQRFCIIIAAVLSSHMQVSFIPPGHFSIFIVHCGIIMLGMLPASEFIIPMRPIIMGMPIIGIPIMPPICPIPMLIILSLLIVVFMTSSTCSDGLLPPRFFPWSSACTVRDKSQRGQPYRRTPSQGKNFRTFV
jgi:hypothetical protein